MKLISKPEKISKDHYLLKIQYQGSDPIPGQFVSIKVNEGTDPLLRRPFSIFDYSENELKIVFKVAGKATSILQNSALPENTDISGPYGKGFTPLENSKVLLIGGGVGNAPLHYLSNKLRKTGCNVTYIYGSRSAEYIYCRDDFHKCSDSTYYMTDDGTDGEKGFVSEKLSQLIKKEFFDFAYICGPSPMMKLCADILKAQNINGEVSLENYFGCGIGICSGCTVKTVNGNRRACIDGPVFNINEILL
ncbi:MAG: dihydroorotate dehydrogenase electron transfer subunit [Spirochaetes bacterium]|nr:dihydroorotate dehydrogenase electron transfer subunit [Spirochaetota bacterium]